MVETAAFRHGGRFDVLCCEFLSNIQFIRNEYVIYDDAWLKSS